MLDSYWFGFLLQVVAVAVAAWAAIALFGAARRGVFALGLAGVASALLAGQYAIGVKPAISHLRDVDRKFPVTDKQAGRTWCVNEPGLPDLNFVRFVQARMPAGSRYELLMPQDPAQLGVPMCLALILAPSAQTSDSSRAQYAVFFGDIPERYGSRAVASNPAYEGYAPNMGLLRLGS